MRLRFLTLAFLAANIVLVHAEPPTDEIAEKFKQLDTNHDGVLSGDELNALPILRKLDLNGDGKVTLEEAREALARMRQAGDKLKDKLIEIGAIGSDGHVNVDLVFKHFDRNGDGKLTPDELPFPKWFERLDLNKDGVITLDEARQVLGGIAAGRAPTRTLPGTASFTETDVAPLKEEPLPLKAGDHEVGRRIDALTLQNLDGHDIPLACAPGDQALVVALFSATCPISNKVGPELARIEKDYIGRKVAFYFVNIAPETKPEEVRKFVTSFGFKSPVLNDPAQALQRALAATTSTEVFILDAARTLVYRGAINDQYGLGYAKDAPRENYLRTALDAVLGGSTPAVTATTAPGCALDVHQPTPRTNLTYTHDISRILQSNCVGCHRQEGIAPFSLETYSDVIEHAGMMRKQVTRGAMPPWFAAPSATQAHLWANDRSLSDSDKTDLLAWLNSDRPKGNDADAPLPLHFVDEWMIGKPDAIFQIPQPIPIKAEGTMPYQNVVVETNLPEDRWVRGYEIQPTNRAVVHHVIVSVHPPGEKITGNGAEAGFFAAYVPGNSYHLLPEGFAKLLPAGSRLSFQIHYTPNGHATQEQIKIGLLYAAGPPQYEVHVSSVVQPRLNIPPGDANHVETAETTVPANMMLMSFMPHMHVRGKAFKYELTTPDGKSETLLDIPHYDFNWQLQYDYAQPKFIPAGSKIKITAVFDNSAGNPANPDPTQTVHWGPQTFNEMMIGYVEHFTPYTGNKVAKQ
jgi:Ca2+-binding EF-hand superfamily protein